METHNSFHGSKAPTSQSSRLAAKPTWEVMELISTHAFENPVPDSEKTFLCGAAFSAFGQHHFGAKIKRNEPYTLW